MKEGEVVKVMIIQKVKRDFQPLATTGLPLLDQTVESRMLAMKTSKAYKRI